MTKNARGKLLYIGQFNINGRHSNKRSWSKTRISRNSGMDKDRFNLVRARCKCSTAWQYHNQIGRYERYKQFYLKEVHKQQVTQMKVTVPSV